MINPPLCPLCGRRASERRGAPTTYSMFREHSLCPSPFHDAGDWGPTLLEALDSLRDGYLPMMRMAINADDPKAELVMRVKEMIEAIDKAAVAVEGKEGKDA